MTVPFEIEEDRGGCDCSASLAGNSPPHHSSCPMYSPPVVGDLDAPVPNRFDPSKRGFQP